MVQRNFVICQWQLPSLALLSWLAQRGVTSSVTVITVDTSFSSPVGQELVNVGKQWAKSLGFIVETLKPAQSFAQLVINNDFFPSVSNNYCVSLLKAATINEYLDEVDPRAQANIYLPVLATQVAPYDLAVGFEVPSVAHPAAMYYGERSVAAPFCDPQLKDWRAYLPSDKAPLYLADLQKKCGARPLECMPCIYYKMGDTAKLNGQDIVWGGVLQRLHNLEKKLGKTMLPNESESLNSDTEKKPELMDYNSASLSCHAWYCCGL